MVVSMISRLIAGWLVYLLPAYNTFKALKHRPLSEPELERLAMYWCVMGAFIAVESTTEWLYSWFPFYFELKTLVLLFLALPQTQGSTYIYKSFLEPYLIKNEADFDHTIVSLQTQSVTFMQHHLARLWDVIISLVNKSPRGVQGATPTGAPGYPAQQPANGTPAAVPAGPWVESAKGLWSAYGPAVVGALNRARPAAAAPAAPPMPTRPSTGSTSSYQARGASADYRAAPPNLSSPGLQSPPLFPDAHPPFPTPELH